MACFGTTKYCHAWLRNAHVFISRHTSILIVSICTRSRVQQITGATNLLQHRLGSMLPPPLDAFSSAKPIVNVPSSNAASVPMYSPPSGSGSSSRSTALPAGASWGSHIANQQSLATSVTSNGSSEIQRTTSVNGTLAFSVVVANAAHGPVSSSDILKRPSRKEESQIVANKSKPKVLKPLEHNVVADSGSKITTSPDRDPPSNRLSSLTNSSYDGRDLAKPSATVNSFDDTYEAVEEPTSNVGWIAQTLMKKLLHQRSDLQSQMQVSSKWDVEDISSLDSQRHHLEEEDIKLSRFLSNSSSSILNSNRLASCSSLPSGHPGVNNSNLRFSSDSDRLHLPNIYGEKSMFSVEHSLFANDSMKKVRNGEDDKIPNILGLDFDPWDESVTSPNNLAELLGEVDQRSSTLNQSKFSFARYGESSNQGFERENRSIYGQFSRDQPISESVASRDIYRDNLRSVNGFASNYSGGLESFIASPLYSSYKAPVPICFSVVLLAVSRPQISALLGFSAPSRLPPPGFFSHERVGLSSDTAAGTRFLDTGSFMRNAYQSLPPVGNPTGVNDIEFVDPTILAVGRGMINTYLDMRSSFSSQMNSFGNETGLQVNLSPSPTDPYGFSSRLMDHIIRHKEVAYLISHSSKDNNHQQIQSCLMVIGINGMKPFELFMHGRAS
ncbi:hypothetical protein Bca4012_045416 [Brassica carinata]